MNRTPEATISLYWDAGRKHWVAIARERGRAVQTFKIESTAPLDRASMKLLTAALQREMESWLF